MDTTAIRTHLQPLPARNHQTNRLVRLYWRTDALPIGHRRPARCVQLKAFTLGVAMVAAFSLGVGLSLIAIGLAVVWTSGKLANHWPGFDRARGAIALSLRRASHDRRRHHDAHRSQCHRHLFVTQAELAAVRQINADASVADFFRHNHEAPNIADAGFRSKAPRLSGDI